MEVENKSVTEFFSDEIEDIYLNNSTNASNNVVNITRDHPRITVLEVLELLHSPDVHGQQLAFYQMFAFAIGVIIILSNLVVVISSGLILKKGQEPRSTYILLGNVSLADTFIGLTLVFGLSIERYSMSREMCLIHIGLVACPTMVSMLSVCLIAIDRYLYILHGLHYYRWVTTRRLRITILLTWLLSVIQAFLPAMGWSNEPLLESGCWYTEFSPPGYIYLTSSIAFVTIAIVCILYTMILFTALKHVKEIKIIKQISKKFARKKRAKIKHTNPTFEEPVSLNSLDKNGVGTSLSCPNLTNVGDPQIARISSSRVTLNLRELSPKVEYNISCLKSDLSLCTIETSVASSSNVYRIDEYQPKIIFTRSQPNKCRAITIVLLTSSCFICTWLPYFISLVIFASCNNLRANEHCTKTEINVTGSLAVLGLSNSIMNPMIYAWWHKGFKNSFRKVVIVYCKLRKKNV